MLDARPAMQQDGGVTTLTDIEWEAPILEPTRDRALEAYVRTTLGNVPPLVTYFYNCPWIVRSMVALEGGPQHSLVHVDGDLARLVDLVVSQDNACRYCYAATRAMLKIFGFPEARIRKVEHDLQSAELSPRVTLALEFVRRVSRAKPLPSVTDMQRLRDAAYSDGAVRELTFLAAVTVYFNRLATLPAVSTESVERMERSWALALLRPLIARVLTFKSRKARPPRAQPHTGPYAYLVDAFRGLPVAAALSVALSEAFDSAVLPRRTKAFAFAVVARGLGCPLSEREAAQLLIAEGIAPSEIAATLAHLASPVLDPIEAAVVPFARETIWYRPVQIQRRARALRAQLTCEQFLELVGITALANAVCRMSSVVAPR
jgi:alkylhydroperoxidase family enzyme